MIPNFVGRIVEWDRERGYGWIETDGQRIFLHCRDFIERRKRPEVGDLIRFTAGLGPDGRTCAQGAVHLNDGGGFGVLAMLLFIALLGLPVLAIARIPVDLRIVGGLALAVNSVTYWSYAHDKARARSKGGRVSEATLHLLELMGGWPGAFVAQRCLRHKCSKRSYQAGFWTVVLIHQYVAFDSLHGWRFTNAIVDSLKSAG